jgi:isopentenyl diphosphate isomerase/L-lactate dehydrogenase-like FMN-dependent dehydrogenase
MQSQFDASVSWGDIARFRDRWKPFIVKGILDPRHVERAVAIGVDGIMISTTETGSLTVQFRRLTYCRSACPRLRAA